MKKILGLLKKYSLIFSLITVVGIIGVGYYFYNKSQKEIEKIENEIREKYTKAKEYEKAGENAPSPELIGKLTKEKEKYEGNFKYMVNNFSTEQPKVPTFDIYPSIEFKEYILFSENKLYKKAKRMEVNLPSSLGFPKKGLVSPDQIPIFTLQFEVVNNLINLVINSGITSITSITPGTSRKVSFYEMMPIKLVLTGTSNEIIRCLKYFDNPSSYFLVENFLVTKLNENLFKVEINLNAVMLLVGEQKLAGKNEKENPSG
ncbi:MAG TPA: Amuc_1100 family pilus-like protein [bacterium]|nr:Amuc_1100 family pilus-like protein [bacterium]